MPHKFGTIISVHFILDNDAPYTGSRGDVFIRISKPVVGYFTPTNLYTTTDDDGNDVVK